MPGACSLASHIALIWAGLPYEVAVLSHAEAGRDAFMRVNPKGAVPALALDDGTVLTKSLAVLHYVAALAPDARLGAEPGDLFGQAQMLVAGLEQADDGYLWLDGRLTDGMTPGGRGVGFVFQSYALFSHMTVADNIGFGLRVRRANRPSGAERWLSMMHLQGLGARLPTQLSGG